ncbi:MAG: DUF4345 family protein [Polyangiaceae bacterium]|nr:DUF4345 family protein [Polyangiaceae bacterium]
MNTIKKVYLSANLATYAGFAAAFFAVPRVLGEAIGVRFETAAALADFRAMYGGLCLGVAVVIGMGFRKRRFEQPAMVVSIACAGALLLGRALTLATDGPGNAFIYASMASEVLAVGVGLALAKSSEEALA